MDSDSDPLPPSGSSGSPCASGSARSPSAFSAARSRGCAEPEPFDALITTGTAPATTTAATTTIHQARRDMSFPPDGIPLPARPKRARPIAAADYARCGLPVIGDAVDRACVDVDVEEIARRGIVLDVDRRRL